jgi:uncharacterized protein YbcI
MKGASESVLEECVAPSEFANHGARVVVGQRLMQATSDIFLGWLRVVSPLDGRERDVYSRPRLTIGTEKASSPELTMQARVSQVVVRTMKDLYGRGPTHAKTYLCDEYVFCVMSGGMTRDEETMIRGGEHDAVRDYRLRFQSVIAPELIRRVEDVLGQKVVTYHSQVLFDPDRLVEIFVLDSPEDRDARNRELPPSA